MVVLLSVRGHDWVGREAYFALAGVLIASALLPWPSGFVTAVAPLSPPIAALHWHPLERSDIRGAVPPAT